jgi:hypothetical protein
MVSAVQRHREALRALPPAEWPAYLAAHSGLPGPRGNLELAQAFADEAAPALIRSLARSADEYEASCGAIGLGRLLAEGDPDAEAELHGLAADARWRVREGVAMALQRLGDVDGARLLSLARAWALDSPLVQRAAAAGVCEPRLLVSEAAGVGALDLLDTITSTLVARPAAERRAADVRTLRQGLGYCWSVAVAARPRPGFERLERWARHDDPDVRWIVRQNLGKARLARADPVATDRLRAVLG